jgi:hypothetical protein
MTRRLLVAIAPALAIAAALAFCMGAAPADADRNLIVGISDDSFLWKPAEDAAIARDLGVTAFRVTLKWDGSSRSLSSQDAETVGGVVAATSGLRMIVSVVGQYADYAPQTDAQRDGYCSFVTDLVQRFPTIRDVVIWNEVNLSYFWRAQFDSSGDSASPAAYEALLARCWDQLHAVAADVNVISDISSRGNDNPKAPSNISHSPLNFIARLGAAYRASGRTRPIFDTFGEHPYARSEDYPWKQHDGSSEIGQGDLPRLLDGLAGAFSGTAQRVPGSCSGVDCPTVWFLEAGYQTSPRADKAGLYTGFETEPSPVPDGDGTATSATGVPDQGSQLRDGVSLAYCQEGVGAFSNFLLADEVDLARWQSGVLWADGTRKSSYSALKAVAAKVAAGQIACGGVGASSPPTASASGAAGTSGRSVSATSSRGTVAQPILVVPGSSGGTGGAATSTHKPRVESAGATTVQRPKAETPTRRVRRRAKVPFAVSPAVLRSETVLRSSLRLGGLKELSSFRSRLNSRWLVVDGFYSIPRPGGAVAVWLHQTAEGWKFAGVARGRAVLQRKRGVPCDLAYAFVERGC